jgi:ferrochelatase
MTYDAFLLVSFGGPEGPEEIMPFLESVTRGRGVPEARLLKVRDQYLTMGGKSPINDQNRALLARLGEEFKARGIRLPLFWANRHTAPFFADVLRELEALGHKRVLAFVTSAYGSYSGCRAYREDLERARAVVGAGAPTVEVMRKFWNHPLFLDAWAESLAEAVKQTSGASSAPRLVFTAHSIPVSMARSSPYEAQLRETAGLLAARLGFAEWDLVWQSRSGPPTVPWLEPDIVDHLGTLASQGTRSVLLAPIGFVSDHMEVVYDLDTQAKEAAEGLGISLVRAATPGTHPAFVSMVGELVEERLHVGHGRRALGVLGAGPDQCAATCCPAPAERPR